MARRSGRHGLVILNTTQAAGGAAVKAGESWKVSYKTRKHEVTAFGDANAQKIQDIADITGSVVMFWDDTETKPFAIAKGTTGGFFYGYPDATNVSGCVCFGPIVADCDIDVPSNGPVKVTFNFEAAGDWTFNL